MKKKPPKQERHFTTMYSANFMVGYSFLHHALEAVTAAFTSKAPR